MFHQRIMGGVNEHDLALRRAIFESFAATGSPLASDPATRSLAAQHVVALDDDGRIRMAHPFAAHRDGARVDAGGRTWWGNCAWDGSGSSPRSASRRPRSPRRASRSPGDDDASSECSPPPRHWWDDIGFT